MLDLFYLNLKKIVTMRISRARGSFYLRWAQLWLADTLSRKREKTTFLVSSTMSWNSLWNSFRIYLTWYMNYFLGPFLHRRRNEYPCWDLVSCARWQLVAWDRKKQALCWFFPFGIIWVSVPKRHYPTFFIILILIETFGA